MEASRAKLAILARTSDKNREAPFRSSIFRNFFEGLQEALKVKIGDTSNEISRKIKIRRSESRTLGPREVPKYLF